MFSNISSACLARALVLKPSTRLNTRLLPVAGVAAAREVQTSVRPPMRQGGVLASGCSAFCVSFCTFVPFYYSVCLLYWQVQTSVLPLMRQGGVFSSRCPHLCQYLYFYASKASKLSGKDLQSTHISTR